LLLSLVVIAGLTFALLVLLVSRGRLREACEAAVEAARQRTQMIERELVDTRGRHTQLQQDLQFLTQFLREFPHLTRELHSGSTDRQIPGILLNVVVRSLAPRQAVVLVRRRSSETDPKQGARLVVAAVSPPQSPIEIGTEIPWGHGAVGFAASSQRVMSRSDFESETAVARQKFKSESLPGPEVDLVAPMVFDDQTLGVIALSRPSRTSDDAKAALRLVAQTGARALQGSAAYTQIKTSAELDGLTQIFNKRQMTETLSRLIYEAGERVGGLSIFLFDIDNFKNYNDVNGHLAGDKLLQLLARLVQDNIRKGDVFGRFGGEEFLLILPDTKLSQALAVAYKVRAVIAGHAFPFAERQPLGRVSVSGGVAEFPSDSLESTALLRAADAALYEAKRQGRNRVLAATRGFLSRAEPEIVSDSPFFEEMGRTL
jgi:diguanylate cyclase (GGDEF)-like protein